MKTHYKNQKEISEELKRLRLKRDISIEELKLIEGYFKNEFTILDFIKPTLRFFGKYWLYKFIRR